MSVHASASSAALRLLSPGPGRLLFLVGDGVFAQTGDLPPQRVGRLSDHLRALAETNPVRSAVGVGPVAEARSHAVQLSELEFVLGDLLPLLRSLAGARSGAVFGDPDLSRDFREIEEQASGFLEALDGCDASLAALPTPPRERASLTRMLGLPCALAGTAFIPLQPVDDTPREGFQVAIDGQLYRYRLEATRPLSAFLQALHQVTVRRFGRAVGGNRILQLRAVGLLSAVHSLLSACGATGPVLQFARTHGSRLELQHRRGFWVLVYGPTLRLLGNRAPIWVGLPIRGKNRRARLAIPPGISPVAGGFFTPTGETRCGGICVGLLTQYQHLQSDFFTDAEAVYFWLDAGVVLATGRSVRHQQWRIQRVREGAPPARSTPSGDRVCP